jgi:thermopsin
VRGFRRAMRIGVAVVWVLAVVAISSTWASAVPLGHATPPGSRAPTQAVAPHASVPAVHPSAASPATSPDARAQLQQTVLSELKRAGVPQRDQYLPDFLGGGTLHGNVVKPINSIAPAPMGIGDFGVQNTSGTPTPYVIDSTSWEGTFTYNSGNVFYIDNDGPDVFGVQLNTVLTNVTVAGNSSGVYWTQDVMFYQPSTEQLFFIDNIWNFSNPASYEPASTFYSYNGTPVSPVYYYDESKMYTVAAPFTVDLYTNSSLTVNGSNSYSTVRFGYHIANSANLGIASATFDTVLFNSMVTTASNPPTPQFQVNGGKLTPTNFLLYDSELMIGGPGGGSTTQVYAINASMNLRYWSSGLAKWVNDPTAWSSGTDTGESSEGVGEYYTTPGTMELTGGPSFVEPMWNATPGGNAGVTTFRGALDPSNSFIFISNGSKFYTPTAPWAPTAPGASSYEFFLPPGKYSVEVQLSDYDIDSFSFTGGLGTTFWQNVTLSPDPTVGVYTPLFAWDNAQLATISGSGTGTASDPYVLENDQLTNFSSLYAETNDYLFPVFPGVLINGTTDYFVLENAAPFTVEFPAQADATLARIGLPDTNQLQIEFYDTDHATLWGAPDISGWLSGEMYPYDPAGEVVLWGATNSLIGDNHFVAQGAGLVLMQGGHNTVWGNTFSNGLLYSRTLGTQYGVWEYESNDLLYDNYFNTTVTAWSPSVNLYNGNEQANVNAWNLASAEPSTQGTVVNGFLLTGSIVQASTVCGNWWDDYMVGNPLPFPGAAHPPNIATGGDKCPAGPGGTVVYAVTFTETGDNTGTWSVALAGIVGSSTANSPIVFDMPNGAWNYTVADLPGLSASPASGTVTVNGGIKSVPITFGKAGGTAPPTDYLVTVNETGLPAGTPWSVKVGLVTTYATTGSQVAFTEPNGSYPYSVPAVPDYVLGSTPGTFVVNAGPAAVALTFTAVPGWINATFTPTNASVWLNGVAVPLTSGVFRVQEAPGTYSLEAMGSGYAPYFNNVTVTAGANVALSVHLTVLGSTTQPKNTTTTITQNNGLTSTQFYAIVGALLVVAAAVVATGFLLRGRRPPAEPPTPPAPPGPAEPELAPPEAMEGAPGGEPPAT